MLCAVLSTVMARPYHSSTQGVLQNAMVARPYRSSTQGVLHTRPSLNDFLTTYLQAAQQRAMPQYGYPEYQPTYHQLPSSTYQQLPISSYQQLPVSSYQQLPANSYQQSYLQQRQRRTQVRIHLQFATRKPVEVLQLACSLNHSEQIQQLK